MAFWRDLDELTFKTEHARPVHPVRELLSHRFYLGGFVSADGGLSLMMLDGLLLVPLALAALFYPIQAMIWAGALLVLSLGGYRGWMSWQRHHPQG